MKAIRSWHVTTAYYFELFKEIANLSFSEYCKLEKQIIIPKVKNFDGTDQLTSMREQFAALGYEKEIEQTDERFLREHRGFKTEEAWEEFWEKYCKKFDVPPYPPDAL